MNLERISKGSVYLMPITAISLSLAMLLQANGYDVRGILDNNYSASGKKFRNIDIMTPKNGVVVEQTPIIICHHRAIKGMEAQLTSLGINNIVVYDEIVSLSDADTLINLFRTIDEIELENIAPVYKDLCKVADLNIRQSIRLIRGSDENAVNIPSLNLMITERCSLKCENCCALMQYFDNPAEYPVKDILEGFEQLLSNVDFIGGVAIIGGEPFLHRELSVIAEKICGYEKVGTVAIVTNGTILPDDSICSRLSKNKKLHVVISDYGELSRKKDELIDAFERHGIPYMFKEEMVWYDYAKLLEADSRTEKEVNETYRICDMNCAALAGSRFSKCQVALSLKLLEAIPQECEKEKSVIDLTSGANRDTLAKHLNSFNAMGACYVCSGKTRQADVKRITPAIQTRTPLPYQKYGNT